jgi:Spy/CpxP family protein refolding chaperone
MAMSVARMLRSTNRLSRPGLCRLRPAGDMTGQARLLAVLLPLLWLAGCASAGPAADAAPAAGIAAASPEREAASEAEGSSRWARRNEVRCIEGTITGSHFRRQICLTEAQWAKLEEDGKQALRELQGPKVGQR